MTVMYRKGDVTINTNINIDVDRLHVTTDLSIMWCEQTPPMVSFKEYVKSFVPFIRHIMVNEFVEPPTYMFVGCETYLILKNLDRFVEYKTYKKVDEVSGRHIVGKFLGMYVVIDPGSDTFGSTYIGRYNFMLANSYEGIVGTILKHT